MVSHNIFDKIKGNISQFSFFEYSNNEYTLIFIFFHNFFELVDLREYFSLKITIILYVHSCVKVYSIVFVICIL